MGGETLLELEGITKSFGENRILKGISLSVGRSEFLTFLGPSGCGKTTLLRIIGGFEAPDSGRVRLDGRDITELLAHQRDIHTVFQHYALFPHYNVFENIAFGLRIRKLPELEIVRRVAEALALVKLSGFESRRTTQLSGGQMQRVALARALVGRPAVLLLDEPLGALDFKLRKEMQLELKTIQRELHMTFVYVTHDQEEAMTLSDRIAVFHAGRIEQIGVPEEIYERPKTSFVADFIGAANVLSARLLSASEGRVRVRIEDELELELPYAGQVPVPVGEPINVAIRPERIAIRYRVDNAEIDGSVRLKGSLVENVYVGNASQIFFQPFAKNTRALLSVSLEPQHRAKRQIGSPLWADIRPRDFLLLEPSPNGNQSQ